ncbi:MAG: carboxypeptidase-like regulatory domain-containing protein [Acidobacteria bacterium]|nr:carboxypeptidase-like regulatory domain-containing protein [Acidobacteriota bacterium]MCA1642512.1 carboxypeptidase-like regulatory domain-containing protein [Acidobacteriota bacterium]
MPFKRLINLIARASLIALTLALVSQPARAQQKGRIDGVVRDAAKAPVAGARVTAINQVTTRRETARTTGDGRFGFKLPAGAYRILVEAAGAQGFDRENVFVEPGKETAIEVELKAADDTEAVARVVDPTAGERPTGAAGGASVKSQPSTDPRVREARDRWRVTFPEYDRYGDAGGRGRDVPFKRGRWYDPYNQNRLKGDYPVIGNKIFLILSAADTLSVEQRRTPLPSNVNSARPGSAEFFGKPEVLAATHTLQFSVELFHGDTTFRPRTWALKLSPTLSLPNYVRAREVGVVHIDPRRATTRTDAHFSFEEAFAEVKLADVNANFDFVSVRAGIQPFVSDFRGFLYTDNNLGARLFGGFANNRYNFNLAYFAQLEKDTNSGLNRFDRRRQNVYLFNLYRQDFIRHGFTGQLTFAFNDDRRSVEYDRNGFLVRPALVGDARPHAVKVGYLGLNTDGHLGRLNLTSSYYFALGQDERNPIAGRYQRVRAHMLAAEGSVDRDFLRLRASAFFASGDRDPTDGVATGFDAILDDPNFVGGQFSFWNRVGIPLVSTAVGLVQPNSVLPSLRSSKTQGQANFVNPGILIANGGIDAEVTQRIKAIFNANYLRFHRTESLEYLLHQNQIRKEIGWDLSLGVVYRPLLINNVQFAFGASTLKPGRGFRDIYTDSTRNCPLPDFCSSDGVVIDPSKPLYSVFAQAKFIF